MSYKKQYFFNCFWPLSKPMVRLVTMKRLMNCWTPRGMEEGDSRTQREKNAKTKDGSTKIRKQFQKHIFLGNMKSIGNLI